MAKRLMATILSAVLIISTMTGCTQNKTVSRSDFALDTIVTITLYGTDDSSLLDKPFEKIRELNDKFDVFSENSEVSMINRNAGKKAVQVSEETFDVIEFGLEYAEKTQGALDITIGPLVSLWKIGKPGSDTVPDADAIENARRKVDYRKVQLNEADHSVYLEEEGMALNLGAVAKGYIGDSVKKILLEEGVDRAVINLGGNVVLIGSHTRTQPFSVGIKNPEDTEGENIGVLSVSDCAVVTSGDYERYFIAEDGRRYHHILDPQTGYPAESGLRQITIISKESGMADALSTACFILGKDESIKLLEKFDAEGVFVTEDNQVITTEGLNELFTFNYNSEGYVYANHK